MNSLRQVQPHGSSSSSSRRPTPSRPSKPAKTLVVFACRPRFSTSYSHHCKGLPLCIGWPSPAYRMVFVTMASLTRQFGREYPEEGQGVQAVGSIVTPLLPGESAWIRCAYHLGTLRPHASWEALREVEPPGHRLLSLRLCPLGVCVCGYVKTTACLCVWQNEKKLVITSTHWKGIPS